MIFHRRALASTVLAGLAASVAAQEKVNISLQPAYWAIPIWTAKEKGWFTELGLEVELSVYPSGAPQVQAAVDTQAWDVGIAGSVPNVIAGAQKIKTIGISNDESATTEVIGAPGVTEWPPTTLTETIFAGTPKSTGELLLRKCLKAAGLSFDDTHIMFDQQAPIMEALLADGDPSYASLWAPNTYTFRQENPTAQVFCSGRHVDFPIFGGLMVREAFAEEKPQVLLKVLAAYLRGVTFMQNAEDIDEVLKMSDGYHKWSGTTLSENAMKEDLILRPLFNLDQQLDHLGRNFANDYTSDADRHYIELEEFLFDEGVISNKFEPKEYVTDEYMLQVSQDPRLRAFAYAGAADYSKLSAGTKLATITGLITAAVGAAFLLM